MRYKKRKSVTVRFNLVRVDGEEEVGIEVCKSVGNDVVEVESWYVGGAASCPVGQGCEYEVVVLD